MNGVGVNCVGDGAATNGGDGGTPAIGLGGAVVPTGEGTRGGGGEYRGELVPVPGVGADIVAGGGVVD